MTTENPWITRSNLDRTMLEDIEESFQLSTHYNPHPSQQFFEFSLSDFGLPSAEELLASTIAVEQYLGGVTALKGWRSKNQESTTYKGFSMTYNPALGIDPYATYGDYRLDQTFSRTEGHDRITSLKNSYHDTYGFSAILPHIEEHFSSLLGKLDCSLTRSRVSYIVPNDETIYKFGYHKDEFIFQNLRINIPLQTDPAYVLEIAGEDEYGNALTMEKHLEVGKFYVWNTRIPHRVYAKHPPTSSLPRIHIVLGLSTWVDVREDQYRKSKWFGYQPFDLLTEGKLFK